MTPTCWMCGAVLDSSGYEPLVRLVCWNCGQKNLLQRPFDHFVPVETLGAGGMGTVYKGARHATGGICADCARLQRMIAPDPKQRFSLYDELLAELDPARRALETADARRHSSRGPFSGLFRHN